MKYPKLISPRGLKKGMLITMLVMCNTISVFAQQKPVTGKVTDESGNPIAGATVSVKGSNQKVLTKEDGSYTINVADDNTELVITFIGKKEIIIKVGQQTAINLTLQAAESSNLDDVIVIGYGTVKKRDLTGAVSSVQSKDILLSPVANPMEALQGRVSGLDIQRGSGRAGQAPSVLLRGNRSLTADQDPLYIIDGIPSSISNINPNDIETIDVLKDASSTAIYGSAGANGVIIVTTKKAKAGRVQVDLSSYYGVNGFASFPKPLMGDAWLNYQKDKFFLTNGYEATDLTELVSSSAARNAIENNQWLDWVDVVMNKGLQQNHHITVRGGTDKVQSYLSVGKLIEKGIYENDKVDILNGRGGVDIKFNNYFKAGFQAIITSKNNNSTNSRINKAYGVYPVGVPYDSLNNIRLNPIDGDNTISLIANNIPGAYVNQQKNFTTQINPYFEFTPIKNLTWRSNFGVNYSNYRNGEFANKNSYNFATEGRVNSAASYNTGFSNGMIWENIVNYKFTIAKSHDIGLTGITSWATNKNETTVLAGEGLDYDQFLFYNMGAFKTSTAHSNAFSQTSRMSYAGRLSYSYKGKYLLNASSRWDGASQLAEGNKWAVFPAISAAWNIGQEDFMENFSSVLTNLKIRAGYGVSGSARINPYVSLSEAVAKTVPTNMSLGGTSVLPVYALTQFIANSDLTWERSYNTNLGLDFSIMKNRVDVTAEWYKTQTKGILWARKIPTSSGGYDAKTPYTKMSNIAESENVGFELTVNTRNVVKKNFSWNSTITFTTAREKLTNIDLGKLSVTDLIAEGLFVGYPARGVFYGYKKLGIWQLGEEEAAAKYGAAPGDIKLQTVPSGPDSASDHGVHPYSAKDRMIVGDNTPTWYMGFQNTFRYKNVDLTVFFNARFGHMIDAQVLGYYNSTAQPETYNYWMPSNPTNDFPRPGGGINTIYQSALSLVDGSFIKLKNITLGYTLPTALGKKLHISNLRIYATAQNPFIYTRSHLLKNVDPESGGSDSFPLFKQFVFGLNLSL